MGEEKGYEEMINTYLLKKKIQRHTDNLQERYKI